MDTSSCRTPLTPMEPRSPRFLGLEAKRPATPLRPSAMLAFRMKRSSGGILSSARRALTGLGKNNSEYNLSLAETLLDVPREKFTKKWNFDPVNVVPLSPGQYQWTPTTPVSSRNYSTIPTPTTTTSVELRLQPTSPHTAGDAPQVTGISVTLTNARDETGKKPVNCGGVGSQEATSATVTTTVYCSSNKENSLREQPNSILRRLSLGLKPVQNKRRKQNSVRRQSLPTSQPIITDFLRPRKRPISSMSLLPTSPKKRMLAF